MCMCKLLWVALSGGWEQCQKHNSRVSHGGDGRPHSGDCPSQLPITPSLSTVRAQYNHKWNHEEPALTKQCSREEQIPSGEVIQASFMNIQNHKVYWANWDIGLNIPQRVQQEVLSSLHLNANDNKTAWQWRFEKLI